MNIDDTRRQNLRNMVEEALCIDDHTEILKRLADIFKKCVKEIHSNLTDEEYVNDFMKSYSDTLQISAKVNHNIVKYLENIGIKFNLSHIIDYNCDINDANNIICNTNDCDILHIDLTKNTYMLRTYLRSLGRRYTLYIHEGSCTCKMISPIVKEEFDLMDHHTKKEYFGNRLLKKDYICLNIMLDCGYIYECISLSDFSCKKCKQRVLTSSLDIQFILKHTDIDYELGQTMFLHYFEDRRSEADFGHVAFKKYIENINWKQSANYYLMQHLVNLPEITDIIETITNNNSSHKELYIAFQLLNLYPEIIESSDVLNRKYSDMLIGRFSNNAHDFTILVAMIIKLYSKFKIDLQPYTDIPWIETLVNSTRLAKTKSAANQ